MASYTARPTEELDGWLKASFGRVPGLEAAWRVAVAKIEGNPNIGTPLGQEGRFLGFKFPSDSDRAEDPQFKMLPQLIVAYRLKGDDLIVVEVKIRMGAA